MSAIRASVVLSLLFTPAAPIPPERAKVPVVRFILMGCKDARPRTHNELSAAEREDPQPSLDPRFTVYRLVDELAKHFEKTDTLREQLKDRFDPNCHVLLFARWYDLPIARMDFVVTDEGHVRF